MLTLSGAAGSINSATDCVSHRPPPAALTPNSSSNSPTTPSSGVIVTWPSEPDTSTAMPGLSGTTAAEYNTASPSISIDEIVKLTGRPSAVRTSSTGSKYGSELLRSCSMVTWKVYLLLPPKSSLAVTVMSASPVVPSGAESISVPLVSSTNTSTELITTSTRGFPFSSVCVN